VEEYLRKDAWVGAYSEEERRRGTVNAEGLVLVGDSVAVPDMYAEHLLERVHLIGHMRAADVKSLLAAWKLHAANGDAMLRKIIQSCQGCQLGKPAYAPPLGHVFCGAEPLDVVFIDFTEMEGRYAVVFVDGATKFGYARLINNLTTETLEDEMVAFIGIFGVPKRVTTDNGVQFKSRKFLWLLSWWGIAHAYSVPYVPRSNGIVERAIGTLVSAARCGYLQRCLTQKQADSPATRDEYLRHALAEAVLKHNIANNAFGQMFQRAPPSICRWSAVQNAAPGYGSLQVGTPVLVKIPEEQRKSKLSPLFEDQDWKVLKRVGSNQYYLCRRDDESKVSSVLYSRAQLKPVGEEVTD
jgi:transposase InsO family protein